MLAVSTIEELQGRLGQELGVSDWHPVTQRVHQHLRSEVTHDQQWIHTDVEKATQLGPFGGTIAHGYYTLRPRDASHAAGGLPRGLRMVVNYGLNRVRFPPFAGGIGAVCGFRWRGSRADRARDVTFLMSFECAAQDKPVCIAESGGTRL